MELKERRFPYPVLSPNTSDYPLGYFDYKIEAGNHCLYIDCELHEDVIHRYIESGDFVYVVGIESTRTRYRRLFRQNNPHFIIPFEDNQVGDKLHLNVLILAARDVTDYPTQQLNSVYHGRQVFFKAGDYIAKCPTHYIYFEFENEVRKSGIIVKENTAIDSFHIEVTRECIIINLSIENFAIYKNYRNNEHKKLTILTSIFYVAIMTGVNQLILWDEQEDLTEENQGWIPLVLRKIKSCGYTFDALRNDATLVIPVVNAILNDPMNDLFKSFTRDEE